MAAKRYTDFMIFRRLMRHARPYRFHIFGLFWLDMMAVPMMLLAPLPLKIAVDSVIGSAPLPRFLSALLPASFSRSDAAVLIFAAGFMVVIALMHRLQGLGSAQLYTYIGEKLVLALRSHLFHHVQRLSLLYHDMKGTSDATYRILWDALAIRYLTVDGFVPIIARFFTLVAMIYVTMRLDWQLALVALTVTPILFLLVHIYRHRLRDQWQEVKKLESTAYSVVQEVLGAIRIVKAFGREDRETERFVSRSNEGIGVHLRVSLSAKWLDVFIGMTITCGSALVLFLGIRHVQTNVLTLGELLIVIAYLSMLYGPLEFISKQVGSLQSYLASAERALSLLDEAPEVVERPHARPLARAKKTIAFQDVSFAYNGENSVLRNISFDVPLGAARVGIAGKTGAGKSTLMSLLIRFYDPTDGRILLDGVDLRDYKLDNLRHQFSIVLQEPFLFSTSIAENIAFARPDAAKEEIEEAARAANAHEFIIDLPDGYETFVGARGMRLSGGERQRIALARAFLKDAPILILDEPTNAVDVKTEAKIMEAMERLMRGRTTFMIAHRLNTLANCDKLLVIEKGRLVET